MLLAIDIGNSNVTLGFYYQQEWKYIWRFPTRTDLEAPLFYQVQLSNRLMEAGIGAANVNKFILSSVVPDLTAVFEHLADHIFKIPVFTLKPDVYHKLQLQIDRPNEIGTDLLANSAAAYYLYQKDSIIVDFGTALTFTTVNAQGHISGGFYCAWPKNSN